MSEALVERLRGIYRIPITDGLGAVGSGEEPDNPNEFVRKFETAPIQHEAADRIEALETREARLSEALRAIVARSHNDPLGTSKVNDMRNIATAALSGSGSGWRLVPYLWQCKDYADGWLSFANEDEAQAYQRDTGCAVRITYRPLPAAPQQGGE